MKKINNFIIGRIKSVKYAARGAWFLLTNEHSIIAQTIIGVLVTILGLLMDLNSTEWLFQILAIAIVIISESLNTAIEEIANFIHPNYHEKIGLIKDIAAGASFFAALFSICIGLIIYLPKFIELL
jgi:diacylglycerol kinase (ATP)